MVPLVMSAAVALPQLMGFGGCGWTSSFNVSIMVCPSFRFMNSAPNSASDSNDATHFKIMQRV